MIRNRVPEDPGRRGDPGPRTLGMGLLFAACLAAAACAGQRAPASSGAGLAPRAVRPAGGPSTPVELGIEVVALRLSAEGHLLDLRYRVEDPEKARLVLAGKTTPSLVDPATGRKFVVPSMAYVGALRQTAVDPQEGKVYFILFANPYGDIRAGQSLDLVLGDRTVPGLTIR